MPANKSQVIIPKGSKEFPIQADLYSNNSSALVVFVNGDGTTSDFEPIAIRLADELPAYDYLTFFFRGIPEGKEPNYKERIQNLADLLEFAKREYNYTSATLVATSSGSIAATFSLQNPPLPITNAVYLDPADYYLPNDDHVELNIDTWDGSAEYNPQSKTLADLMSEITSQVKVDVVGFTVRNTIGHHYVEASRRHLDQEGCFPRLNQQMVKSFHEKTPAANKGEYLTINDIPHAYLRDGIIEQNVELLVALLKKLLR